MQKANPHKASADLQQRRAAAEAKLADLRARLDAEIDPDRILSLRRAIRDTEDELAALAAAEAAALRAAREAEEAARRERLRLWSAEELPRCLRELEEARELVLDRLRAAAEAYNALQKLHADWDRRWREAGAPDDARLPYAPVGTVVQWAAGLDEHAQRGRATGRVAPFAARLHDALRGGGA